MDAGFIAERADHHHGRRSGGTHGYQADGYHMITQDIALAAVNNLGLDTLGVASGQLTTRWSDQAVTFDEATMRCATGGIWRAMASGMIIWRPLGAPEITDAAGAPINAAVALLRFHPQTHLRLARL